MEIKSPAGLRGNGRGSRPALLPVLFPVLGRVLRAALGLALTVLPARAAFPDVQQAHPPVVPGVANDPKVEWVDGGAAWIRLTNGILRIKPCAGNTVRVTYSPAAAIPDLSSPVMADTACSAAPFTVENTDKRVEIVTPDLKVAVDRYSGALQFEDLSGNKLLEESEWPYPRRVLPTTTDGEETHKASVWFALNQQERLYGLGQHQNGILNQRNLEMELSQDNTNISIPFFLSSNGYGVLWNNTSVTRWNNRFQPVLNIQSNFADVVDYYFIYGPSFDTIIAGYRQLTGKPPLFPLWAYGYWQCKLAYSSQTELLDVAAKYRRLGIPLDNIVLDAGWETNFGSRTFTPKYPDPAAMVKTLHDEHVNIMVSIWPLFQPGNANYDEMQQKGFLISGGSDPLPAYLPGTRLYDPFNPEARKSYWQQTKKALYDIGFDAFWMDSTEPGDLYSEAHGSMIAGAKTALGNGSKYANIYPLMTTEAIYDGQRSVTDQKRVFILSRSAFAGMQRNAAAAWSGDIATNFDTLRREIPAGLNYSMTGLPYWTTDIGGFVGGDTSDPAYREVFVRWFQYGSFCPIFRVHGTRKNNMNELWSYGEQAQSILTLYDKLRYRLLPYIYSAAARTTFDGYTPMRALAFDFREDPKALDLSDEFMFGASLLVAPVTEAGAASRNVYLPAGAGWYDFWTGTRTAGGHSVVRATPLAVMPLYVRAGTILPLGAEVQYSSQSPAGPIELRIYPGADADANLYEDDGITYDYEKGASVNVPIHWNDKSKILTLGPRKGEFSQMIRRREFHIVVVGPNRGLGEEVSTGGRIVAYSGTSQSIQF